MTASLLERIAAGDDAAVGETLDRYGGLVSNLARRYCPNADVDDAVQDVFISVWRDAARFDPARAKETTFVAMIARRRLIDRLRRTGPRVDTEALESAPEPTAPTVNDPAELADELDRVRAVVGNLDREHQHLLELTVCEGLSHSQAAEHLALPLGTVKSRVRRGLARIREELGRGPRRDVAEVNA
ncbi:MAG: RNA polymerase [Planctomycetota bacterium]|nr:MAG: RNA polymerase [Planctomycetota bacterium]